MVVDHRGEQVVGGADRVQVAGEVQIDVFHRHHLRVASAGGASFDAEARTHARLTQAEHRLFADQVERIAEADRRRRLALAGRRRGDRGDEDQLAVWPLAQRADVIERDFGFVPAIGRHRGVGDTELFRGDLADRAHCGGLGDLDVGLRVSVLLVSARHAVSPC